MDGVMQFLELAVDIRLDGRIADIGVDLDAGDLADRHGIEALFQVIDVGRNDEPAYRDLVADGLRRQPFPLGDALHLGGNRALTGEEHLGAAGHTELPSPVRTGSGYEGVISARGIVPGHAWRRLNVTWAKNRQG